MKDRILIFFRLFFFFVIWFWIARFVFLCYNYNQSLHISFKDWFLTFVYGTRMDLSMTGYLMVLPGLYLIASPFITNKINYRVLKIISIFFLVITGFLIISDMELYRHWGFRLDTTPLLYLKNPKEVVGSFNFMATILQLIIFTLLLFLGIKGWEKFVGIKIKSLNKTNGISSLVMFFLTATLILPVRGSLGIAPINPGFVYFHTSSTFANHSALNVVWNAFFALTNMEEIKPVIYFDDAVAHENFETLYKNQGETKKIFKTDKPNIIILILESFSNKIVSELGGMKGITPCIDSLAREGILFRNCYASGDRTDKGILAIMNAYPSQPTTSIVKYSNKIETLPFITKKLKKAGYFTEWVCGLDLNFANFNSYMTVASFDKIISINDFPKNTYNSKWGTHDHIVLEKLLAECNTRLEPFFMTFMSLTSHEPFEIPTQTVIQGTDEEHKFLNACNYTDRSVGEFIKAAKQTDWWKNTIVIITADHGSRHPGNTDYNAPEKFAVPMLWLGGALTVKDTVVYKTVSQTDIASSILNQLNIESYEFKFSKDIFAANSKSFAFYCFNNGFGFITDSVKIVYDNVANIPVLTTENNNELNIITGKSYMQVLMDDFTERK